MDKFPNIRYQLRRLFFDSVSDESRGAMTFRSQGALTLHGVTHPLEMPVVIELRQNHLLSVLGVTTLKMSDYSVQPASSPGGNAGPFADEVTISFEWQLERVGTSK